MNPDVCQISCHICRINSKGVILQITELYKSSTATYNHAINLIKSLEGSISSIVVRLQAGDKKMRGYSNLLEHYKKNIESSFTFDNAINEHLIATSSNEALAYIIEKLKPEDDLSDAAIERLKEQCNILLLNIKTTKDNL